MRINEDIPILGNVTVNFLDLSSRIYAIYSKTDEIKRQKEIPHLGLISYAFRNSNHSRFDYLILQNVISEIIENTFKGTTNAQGSIKINNKVYLGNDIIKSWALLSNFGHCKNTIGDEKTILLYCLQNKSFKNKLLFSIKDDQLKEWSKNVIENYDYISFHHILSIYRIYKTLRKKNELKDEIFTVYKLLLLPTELNKNIASQIQITQLKTIFNIIRDISVIALDSRNSSLPINIDILGTVLSIDNFEKRYQNSKISVILEPLYSILCDNLYLDIKSQLQQRSYEVDALKNNTFKFPIIIDKALSEGLYDPKICNLMHFLRIKLHSRNMIFEEMSHATRDVLSVKRNLKNVEASIDINPFNDIRVIDFYITKEFTNKDFTLFIFNISQILLRQIIGTANTEFNKSKTIIEIVEKKLNNTDLNQDQIEGFRAPLKNHINSKIREALFEKNIPVYKDLLWSVIRYHIKPEYYFDIEHHTSLDFDYFSAKVSIYNTLNNISTAIQKESDVDRKHELKQIQKSANRKFNGDIIVCLSRIKIYDYSKPPEKRVITDIDGVVFKFNEKELILEFHESKNTANPVKVAIKDIKKILLKIINPKSIKPSINPVKGFGAKIYFKY